MTRDGAAAEGQSPVPQPPVAAWHSVAQQDLCALLGTTQSGLDSAEAARRLAAYGLNAMPEPRQSSLLLVTLRQLRSPLIYLLLAAAIVSFWLGELGEAGFILLVLAINTMVGAAQEWRAARQRAALRSSLEPWSRARRDGAARRLHSEDLVPGDLVLLEAGERVPADLRLLQAAELQVDESAMTGESLAADKMAGATLAPDTPLGDRITMLYAGTTLQRGRAEGLVVATGAATELGRIAEALGKAPVPPPLTRRLEIFTRVFGLAALLLVGLSVVLQILAGVPLRETFLLATALAVAVIPEGLPVAVTVALSVAARRMARRHVIVSHLPAVEGLGACTVIATDKTGTLTVNQLTARVAWLPGGAPVEIGGTGFDLTGDVASAGQPLPLQARSAFRRMARSGALCNDGSLDRSGATLRGTGDGVDLALLVLAHKAGLEPLEVRSAAERTAELPFSPERRFSATLNRHGEDLRLHIKGAPEVLLPLCHGADAAAAMAMAERMAAEGHRVLALATRRVDSAALLEASLQELELLGLVGFIDPLRPEARAAIAACRTAGVRVVMVTGDHAATALAIAGRLDIAQRPMEVVTGRQLTAASGDAAALTLLVAGASIFARIEPAQKVVIVEALQAAGEIVAMTGDGVNDAPALRRADLGVAMGRDGTDVARDAADLVLADDNFASIVSGIEEGRAAYANIRKVILLLVSTGVAEVMLVLLALASGLPVPLTAVQLLWLNLVTNGGQDVAMAFEQAEPDLLRRPPRAPDQPLFDRLLLRQTALSGLFMGVVSYAVFAWLLAQGWGEAEARNLLLFLLVTFENVHVFNCRSELVSAFRVPLRNNWGLVATVAGAQVIHIGATLAPGLRDVLQVAPISPVAWLGLFAVAASLLLLMEIDKWLRARR